MPVYQDFVEYRAKMNPCIYPLLKQLRQGALLDSKITGIDYNHHGASQTKCHRVAGADAAGWINAIPPNHTRIMLVEDINTRLINEIGEALDVDPMFFAETTTTSYEGIDQALSPPHLARLPSTICQRGFLHLHHQQAMSLGHTDVFTGSKYCLRTVSNVPRDVRRLVPLSDMQVVFVRRCCSILVKNIGTSTFCLVLVDRPPTVVTDGHVTYKISPINGGFEDFGLPPSFSSFERTQHAPPWDRGSVLDSLTHYYKSQPLPGFFDASPSILTLGLYPMRLVLAEWNSYLRITTRYYKYYEYTCRGPPERAYNDDLVELQRWRRRCQSSQTKLALLALFVNHWVQQEADKQFWSTTLKDIEIIQQGLQFYSQSLEQTISVVTSMVQIFDTQRSIIEAVSVKRLTYIALIFIPLSWVASLFSMGPGYAPGEDYFWVYVATSVPLLGSVLFITAMGNLNWQRLSQRLGQIKLL